MYKIIFNTPFSNDSIIHKINNILDTENYGIYNKDDKQTILIHSAFCRIVSSYEYLKYKKFPDTEELVILYMNYCCIMIDAINICLSIFDLQKINTYSCFNDIALNKLGIDEQKYKNDKQFFEFFRSLVFAHPINTDKSLPIKGKNEIKYYAPYILFNKEKEEFGVMVYNENLSLLSLMVSFEKIKEYINRNFERLSEIIKRIDGDINDKYRYNI